MKTKEKAALTHQRGFSIFRQGLAEEGPPLSA